MGGGEGSRGGSGRTAPSTANRPCSAKRSATDYANPTTPVSVDPCRPSGSRCRRNPYRCRTACNYCSYHHTYRNTSTPNYLQKSKPCSRRRHGVPSKQDQSITSVTSCSCSYQQLPLLSGHIFETSSGAPACLLRLKIGVRETGFPAARVIYY